MIGTVVRSGVASVHARLDALAGLDGGIKP